MFKRTDLRQHDRYIIAYDSLLWYLMTFYTYNNPINPKPYIKEACPKPLRTWWCHWRRRWRMAGHLDLNYSVKTAKARVVIADRVCHGSSYVERAEVWQRRNYSLWRNAA